MDRPQDFARSSPVVLPLNAWLKPAIFVVAGFVVLLAAWFAAPGEDITDFAKNFDEGLALLEAGLPL